MIKKVAMVAISAIIGVLLVVTVLTPILMGATSETLTTRNTGSFFAAVSDDDTEHTIIISAGTGSFVITTDDKVDITPSMGTYNPGGVYVSPAIAIGVYEGYVNSDNILTSQAGVSPTVAKTNNQFRSYALAGNTSNNVGTYQLWNLSDYTLYKIMATTIIGNTDAQYVMGNGIFAGGAGLSNTGGTSSAYQKSVSYSAVSLLLENVFGNVWDGLGNVVVSNGDLVSDNTLGGHAIDTVTNVLDGEYDIPLAEGTTYYIESVYTTAEGYGIPKTLTDTLSTAGESINDGVWSNNTGNKIVFVGGSHADAYAKGGLYAWFSSTGTSFSLTPYGTRLAYVMNNYEPTTTNYGYVMTLGEGGATITSVQALVDGELTTDGMSSGTTIGDFWQFNTETGIGPFGAYYVAINLSDVDTTSNVDYLAENMLGTKKGQVAYVLDPTDLTKTLGGTSYTSGDYNIMLVVPTVYWGVSDSKLYMSNSPNTFNSVSGLEMKPYAHTYTVDPSVDTGNPVTTASATVVYGEDYIVRLYSTGDVYLITTNAMTYLGQASGENTVELTVTGDVLGYTPSGGSATTIDDVLAYIASTGKYVQCKNPMYSTSQEGAQFIIGGYANNLTTTTDDVVDIGYCLTVDAADLSLSTITVLNPVSDASNTVDTNGAVWGESTLIKSDLYKVGDLTITTTWSDTGKSVATYNYYLAPEKVVYKNPNYLDNGPVESILNVLPIIIVAGLLLGILSMIVVGKLKE